MPSSLTVALERYSSLPQIDIDTLTGPPASLLDALRLVPDPRSKRGIRYPFSWLLAVCICAALSGDSSLRRIAECATRLALGVRNSAPAATTIQRLLQHVDPDALDQALAAWAATRATGEVIAIDGKELRSAKRGGHDRVHLMAALDHDTGAVLAQIDVHAKTNEIPRLPALLEELNAHRSLKGRIFTIDALHTQTKTAQLICDTHQAHYLMTIKGNQPGLHSQAESHPWDQIPVCDTQEDTSHGRKVRRELKIITPTGVLASTWPGAKQIGQLTRTAVRAKGKEPSVEVVYLITSLTAHQGPATRINDIIRGHWAIEALHYVRDVTFGEDGNGIRIGNTPRILASFTNAAITALRLAGKTNIAEATRANHADPELIHNYLK